MKPQPSFIDLADEEAYEKALQRLICDYCGREYSTYASLHDPLEVYSSKRSVKHWIIVCRFCSVLIHLHERKKGAKEKRNTNTMNDFFLEDPTLYCGEGEEEDEEEFGLEEEDHLQPREDHEF